MSGPATMPAEQPPADKPALSRKRSKIERTDEQIAGAVERQIIALGKRVAAADPDAARLLLGLARAVEEATAVAVAGWRRTGYSDAQIGRELGVTKQAVQQRWPRTL